MAMETPLQAVLEEVQGQLEEIQPYSMHVSI